MFTRCDAKAIGNGSEGAHTILRDNYNKSMSLAQGRALAMQVLAEVRGSA